MYSSETFDPTLDYIMGVVYTTAVPLAATGMVLMIIVFVSLCPCIKRQLVKNISKRMHSTILAISTVMWLGVVSAAISAMILESSLHSHLTGVVASFDEAAAVSDQQDAHIVAISKICSDIINSSTTEAVLDIATELSGLIDIMSTVDNIRDSIKNVQADAGPTVDMISTYSLVAIVTLSSVAVLLSTTMFPLTVTQATKAFTSPWIEKTVVVLSAILIFIAYCTAAVFLAAATVGADFCTDPIQNAIIAEDIQPSSALYKYLTCDPDAPSVNVTAFITAPNGIFQAVQAEPDITPALSGNISLLITETNELTDLIQCSYIQAKINSALDYLCIGLVDAVVNAFLTTLITASFLYLLYVTTRKLPVHASYNVSEGKEKQDVISFNSLAFIKKGIQEGITWRIINPKKDVYALFMSKETHSGFIAYTEWNKLIQEKCADKPIIHQAPYSANGNIIRVSKCNNLTFMEIVGPDD